MPTRSVLRYPVLIFGITSCAPVAEREEKRDADELAATTASLSSDSAACFVSGRSVLARSEEQGAAVLRGWIRLQRFGVTDSANALLVDSDSFALEGSWRRTSADSLVVGGFNDFVQIDLRLRVSDSGASGRLHAHSDAALERDSSGKLREFRRDSRILFSRAPCDSMPPPAGSAAIDVVARGTPRPGIRFDPSTLRRQARIGTLIVDSIHTVRAMDSTWIGTVRFRGDIQLSGWTLRNPDPDLYRVLTCFEADSMSAARLPRWSGDERRAWFCFSNRADAARALGPPSEGVPATIVVDEFTIHRNFSDAVNSVRFVRRVRN